MTSDRDIARWRLASQRLTGTPATSAAAVVAGLLAVQGENVSHTEWAVASRTRDPDAKDLRALLDQGQVIRTHVLRPTWHLVGVEDIGWLLDLTAPRVQPVLARQLQGLGLTVAELDRAAGIVLAGLADQPDQTRGQVSARLAEHGVEPGGLVLMLLLAKLELEQLICSGRAAAGGHTYSLFEQRVPAPRRLDRDEALAELTLRYFTSHGPATERDLAYWATLGLRDVRAGIAAVRGQLASLEHDGRTFWHAPDQVPPPAPRQPEAHLLVLLDEIYRGYQDTRMVLDSQGIVPRGREPALGMALVDGQLVARMKRTLGRRVTFELTPYRGPLPPAAVRALELAAARYGAFLGLEAELTWA